MTYYILNNNNEIELFDTNKKRLKDTLLFKPELADKEIQETEREIVILDNKYVFADEHQEELKQKEIETLSKEIRDRRDAGLNATDFYLMPDYPISSELLIQIKEYRQQLRDLPQQEGFPYVDLPVSPISK